MIELRATIPVNPGYGAETTRLLSECQQDMTETRGFEGCRILVADDNATNRKILAAILAKLGMDAQFAENGAEACDLWRSGTFDLVLLDISMPVMDGIEALRVMRADSQHSGKPLPVAVAATANVMSDQIARYLKEGFTETLAKPLRRQQLEEVLMRRLISDREAKP